MPVLTHPPKKAVHQTIDWVDGPPPSTASVGSRSFATQGVVHAQRVQADANYFDPKESLGEVNPLFANAKNLQSKK